jgi:hypothetical protein
VILVFVGTSSTLLLKDRSDKTARKTNEKKRAYKAARSTELPRTTQDIGEPVTFRGVTRDVTDRVFRPPGEARGDEYGAEEHRPLNRRSMNWVAPVERTGDAEGDPDLPRYGMSSLPLFELDLG